MDGSNKKQEDWEFVPLESKEPSWEFVPLEDKGVLSRAKQAVTDFFTPQPSKEAGPRQLTPEEEMMSSFGAAPAPRKAAPPPLPGEPQAEMTEWQPSLWEEFLGLLPGDRAKAANEVLARRIAREQKIPVDEAYRRMREAVGVRGVAGTRPGGRPMFNPEGRATIQAVTEAAPFVAEGLLDIPKGTAEALLRTYRAGDIESALDKGFVDQSIAYLGDDAKDIFIPNIPKKLGISPDDPNYQSFMGLGKSLGYSLTTMVASIVGATAGSTVGPLGSIAGGMGAAGAVAYRGSKDDFLDRLRTKLNKESKKTFGRPMSDAEWNAARKKFDSAATEYGAWEAVPEAVSNAIFLKAFAAPARTASGARLAGYLEKATSVAAENLTETVTGLGQNAAELKAGLTNNELTVADAFKQQFIQTMMTMGFMAGTLKAKQLATQFYNDQVLPRVSPGSALAKAIEADLNNYVGYTPAAFRSRSATEARAAEEAARRAAGTQAPEPPEAPVAGEPPIAPSGAPGGERIEPTLGAEPELPPSARVEPTFVAPPVQVGASPEEVQAALAQAAPGVVGLEETVPEEAAELPADLTPEEQNLVIAYMQQGFTQEEAVARTLKKRKGAELPDAVRQWDRANRSGRQTEWQVGAAESNPAFESLGSAGYNTPAHGMAKVGTLGEAYNNLVSLLSGNIDPNRPLYTAGLTAPAGVGAGTGTAGGYAYRDGPFIITFRQGLTGQPTSADITGVLVNPANAELVPVLQKQFPNLVVRSYNEVADVVNASRTSAPEGQLAPTEAQVPPAIKPAVTPPQEPSGETASVGMPVVEVPLKDLTLSKDVPQFKMGADAKGVVEPLGGKFERTGVAPIQVWRRLDGSLEVISGRHRLDLARRSGEKTIPAQVHDEAQGFTPTMAAVLDAELNIRDGQGKVKDYVNYFKAAGITPEDAESRGLLARSTGKRAFTIATTGSDELVAAVRNDQVGDEAAYYIALNAPNDPRLQAVGIQGVMDGKSANLAVNMMLAMKALGVENNTTTDMFGFDDSAVKEAQAMAQVANRKQKEIQTRLSAISGAAKNPEVAKSEGIDIRDPDAVNKRIGELRQLKAAWDNWPTNPDLVREVRQARGVQAPSLTLRGETEEEIRAREEAAAAEEQRRRAEEEAAKRAEQEAFDRKRAAETTDLFQLGQTAAQQMSGMGDLFAPPVEEKPAEKPAFQVGERVVYNRPESKIFPDEFPAAQIGATVDFVYNNNRVAIVRDDNGQTEVVPANDLAKPSAEKPAALDLMKDGIEGREIPFTEVPNGREEFQYALGRTEEGGKEAIYRRRANERGTYGGWRWEADKPVAKAEAQKPAAKKEVKANEYFVENLGETLAFPDIIEWYRRAYRNMEQARDAYRKGEIDDEQFLEQKNEFEEIKAEVEQIEAKEYGKPKAAKSAEGRGVDQEFVQKAQNHWMSVVHPALVEYGIAYRQFGEQRMENARIKEPGIGPDEWLKQLWHQQSKFEKGRKVQDTGIQYLSQKDLWPTTDGSGERLRKAMLNAVKALKNAPSTNGEWIKRSINGESDIFGEGAKPAAVKEPAEIRQARREMAQGVKMTPAVLKRRRALIEWEKSQEPAPAIEPEFTADNIVNGEQPAADLPATNRLVFMPCSAKKGGKAGPAMDLYQGVFFQTFRSNVPSDAMPNVVILSAEHGFIGPDTQIEPYDRLLDKARADEILGDMPKVITDIKKAMAGIPADQIKDVLLVGGKEYQAVMRAALAQMKEDGLIPEDASVNATSGGIGEQRQQLGEYLRALPSQAEPVAKPAEKPAPKAKQAVKEEKLPYTKEQREEAEIHAKEVGGDVAWQRGEYALIRGYSLLSGDPVYAPAIGSSRARVDIAAFTGKQVPDDVRQEMLAAKERLEKEAAERHATDPFIKFENGVALSEDIPPELAGVIREWKNLLKLDAPIYVSTLEDAKRNRNNFTGPHRRIGSGTLDENERGSMRRMADDSYYILFERSTSPSLMLETIAHEMGHVHQRLVYERASDADKQALQAAHQRWLESQKGKTAKELVEALRTRAVGRRVKGRPDMKAEDLTSYWKSFSEWYADQTARWAVSAEAPVSVVEKFFKRLGNQLRQFYQSLRGQKYLPDETFKQFIERAISPTYMGPTDQTLPPSDQAEQQLRDIEPEKGLSETINVDGVDRPTRNAGLKAQALNIEDDKKLIAKYNRGNTPMLDKKPLATFMLDQWKNSKDLLKDFINNPLEAAADAGSSAFDAAIKARMSTVWFGAGLESRDFAQYQGQLRTSEGLAIASVALDNAIHSGNIGIQVIFQGGLEYDQRTGRFVAVDRELGMRGVYEAEQKLKKKLGAQLGTNIIQGYLEAKRSISIMNELYDRQEAFEEAKESLSYIVEQGGSEDDINAARDLVAEAKNDLDAVKKAVSSVTMTEEEMYEFAGRDEVHPELRDIMRNWNAINQNLLRVWKSVGLLSEKRYNTLSAIKDYVPWQRIMNDGDDPVTPLQSTTRNLTNIGREKLFKRGKPTDVLDFKGADGKKILNADGQMIGASFAVPPSTVVRVEIDGQKVPAELLSITPEGRVLIEGPIDDNSLVVFKVTRPIQNIVENMTQNVMRMTMNAIRHYAAQRIVYEYATRAPDGRIMTFPSVDPKKGRFNFIIDGQKKIVEISDPLVVASIYGMDKLDLEMWKPLAFISNFVRRSITLSGAFQIEQVIKDAPTAAIVTGVRNPVKLIGGTIKGFITALIQPATKAIGIDIEPTINILKAAGIGGFHSPARTPQAEIKRRMGIMNRNVYDAMIKLLDHIGDSSDMAQRVATYKRVLAETGDESQALMQAANVINFLHRGSSGAAQALFKTVPFMSAYANSTDVLANALIGGNLKGMRRRKAVARLAMTTGLLASLTIIYAMINGGDPEYEELDDETKMKNIIVPGTKVKIPINTSAAYIWKALPEMIYNKIINEGTKNEIDRARLKKALSIAAKDMLLGPEPIPAGIRPVMEVAMDRSFFTERSITPRRLQNVEAFEQWDASTSELGKKLSALTEFGEDGKRVLNPFEADHLVRGIFGSVGFTAQYITNQIAVQAGERPELTGRETPLFGRFIMPEVGRRNEDLFYDLKERVDEKYNTWQTIINRGDDAAADKYEDKHEKLLDLYHDLNKANEELGEINSEIRELGTSKDLNMTPEARRKGINELQREKMEVLEDVIEMRKEGGL